MPWSLPSFLHRAHLLDFSFVHELPHYVAQDAAVLEVGDFWVCVEAALGNEGLASACRHGHILANVHVVTSKVKGEEFVAVKSNALCILFVLEFERQNAHSKQVAAMNSLITLGDHRFYSLQVWTLSSPVP